MRYSFSHAVLKAAEFLDIKLSTPILPDALYVAYGVMTGTELSGTGVCRSLSVSWEQVAREKAKATDQKQLDVIMYRLQHRKELVALVRAFGMDIETLARGELYTEATSNMLEEAEELMRKGMSRLDAQKKVIEDTRRELSANELTPNP